MEFSALQGSQPDMRAKGFRNLVPESLVVQSVDVGKVIYLVAGKTKSNAGETYRTCVGLLHAAGSPVCIRVDVSEVLLSSEGSLIERSQSGGIVSEFSKARAVVA
ncbi:hypothetical protein [Streptomyces sp. CBMA29]|uniref:hypothetical protein n=1 Tax=Streptomyces sp. CBMA29 TaxID=1896314 RepID=UPI001661EA44|nr:hypothetical protein [Streptomyces sp. CBMA29]